MVNQVCFINELEINILRNELITVDSVAVALPGG